MRISTSRRLLAVAHLSLVLSVIMSINSNTRASAETDEFPAAESILDRGVEAIGGYEAHMQFKSRRITGTFLQNMAGHKLKAKIEIRSIAPNKTHIVIEGSPVSIVRVCNGQQAWEWNTGIQHGSGEQHSAGHLPETTHLRTGPDQDRAIEDAQFYANVQWRKNFKKVMTIGLEDVKGRPAYEVQVTDLKGNNSSRFYDKESGRMVKSIRTVVSSNSGEFEVVTYYGKYREFDGVLIATTVDQEMNIPGVGSGTQNRVYTNVEHDLDIPESLFKLPKGLK